MRYDFFISYSRTDAACVRPLVDALVRRERKVFFDVESIGVGDKWKSRLEFAIRDSRALILCWSAAAKQSEYVAFEYARAEGLKKKVMPWLLDPTPLPVMLEVQAIAISDPDSAASIVLKQLGWSLLHRRRACGAIGALAASMAAAGWLFRSQAPPPHFDFRGEVSDDLNQPLAGVDVSVEGKSALSGPDGRFDLRLPGAQPPFVRARFRKSSFADELVNAPTDGIFRFAMKRSPE